MATEFDFSCEAVGTLLVIRGDCDIVGAKRLGERIAAFGDQPVEVDMQGVTFFDSSALSVLLAARERNAQFRVGEVSQEVAIVLKITGTYLLLRDAARPTHDARHESSLSTHGSA